MIGHVLALLAVIYAGLALVVYLFQSSMVYFPEIGREISRTPRQVGLEYEEVQLLAADQVSLHGWYVPVPSSRGTVLLLHGNAGNISHRLDYLLMFQRLGYNTLIIDYRGYGKSAGQPSERGTYRDAEAAWHYLTQVRRIPADRVILFGESLGAAVAAWLAARNSPAALVIASGFTSVPDLAAKFYPFLPVRWLSRFGYDTRASLLNVRVPVLVAHSPDDEIVPYQHGLDLYAAARPPKQFLELAGGHNEGFVFVRESWVQALGGFLGAHLKPAEKQDLIRPAI